MARATQQLRPTLSEVEMDDFIEGCLRDSAVTAFTRQPNGSGFSGEGVTERDQREMENCQAALFEEYPNPPAPSTDAEYMVLYRLYEKETDCLRRLGHKVEMPSFETYRDEGGAWFPYRDLPEPGTADEWQRWNTECPQNPWEYEVRKLQPGRAVG